MLDLGADLDTIKEAMGHSSVTTTQRYVKNTDERVRRYASRIAI
jgi:site-specific recombinase XerD